MSVTKAIASDSCRTASPRLEPFLPLYIVLVRAGIGVMALVLFANLMSIWCQNDALLESGMLFVLGVPTAMVLVLGSMFWITERVGAMYALYEADAGHFLLVNLGIAGAIGAAGLAAAAVAASPLAEWGLELAPWVRSLQLVAGRIQPPLILWLIAAMIAGAWVLRERVAFLLQFGVAQKLRAIVALAGSVTVLTIPYFSHGFVPRAGELLGWKAVEVPSHVWPTSLGLSTMFASVGGTLSLLGLLVWCFFIWQSQRNS